PPALPDSLVVFPFAPLPRPRRLRLGNAAQLGETFGGQIGPLALPIAPLRLHADLPVALGVLAVCHRGQVAAEFAPLLHALTPPIPFPRLPFLAATARPARAGGSSP